LLEITLLEKQCVNYFVILDSVLYCGIPSAFLAFNGRSRLWGSCISPKHWCSHVWRDNWDFWRLSGSTRIPIIPCTNKYLSVSLLPEPNTGHWHSRVWSNNRIPDHRLPSCFGQYQLSHNRTVHSISGIWSATTEWWLLSTKYGNRLSTDTCIPTGWRLPTESIRGWFW